MYPEYPYIGYKEEKKSIPLTFPRQHQDIQPGKENMLTPLPIFDNPAEPTGNKLSGKVAIITGGDSGIGRAVAILYAKNGCDIAIVYLDDNIEAYGRKCILIKGDLRDEKFSKVVVEKTLNELGKIDILVNNAGYQMPQCSILDISTEQLLRTFETNILSYFYLTKAVLPLLKEGSSIINTSSINSFHGNEKLIDYSATKGAVTAFTKSLAKNLAPKKIRVNEVAPGPIWTPLIPSSFSEDDVETFGIDVLMKRAGQPFEVAPAYLYLASNNDAGYVTGQTIHVNGGNII